MLIFILLQTIYGFKFEIKENLKIYQLKFDELISFVERMH